MTRKIISTATSLFILTAVTGIASVAAQTKKNLQQSEKARVAVLRLGTGESARVEVKLRDQSKVSGYVSEAGQDSFKVTGPKTNSTETIMYADVADVKKPGGGSTKTWLIIGGAAAGAVILGLALKPAFCDGGAQTRFPC